MKRYSILSDQLRAKLKENREKMAIKASDLAKTQQEYGYSIIIPAYKSHNYIQQCLDSIVAQSHFKRKISNYEILLGVDGCEKTREKVLAIMDRYAELRVFYFPENRGPYIVKNNLAKEAKYINLLFFDSDDHMKPNMVAEIDKYMKKGFDICKVKYINYHHGKEPHSGILKPKVADGVGCHNKKVHEILGGYESWPNSADSDFCLRSQRHFKISHINSPMFFRRIHPEALTQHPDSNPRSTIRRKYHKIIQNRYSNGFYNKIRKVQHTEAEYEEITNTKD